MDVVIDGDRNFKLQGEQKDVLAVLGVVEAHLRKQGRAIVSVRINGQECLPEELVTRGADLEASAVSTLVVQSEKIARLIDEALEELRGVLPELPVVCRSLAEIFHSEHPQEGYEPFQKLANLWLHIKNRQHLAARVMDLDLNQETINGISLSKIHEELNGSLREAAEALEQQDCILLGDLLEYELAPRAEQESDIVALLQERASAHSG